MNDMYAFLGEIRMFAGNFVPNGWVLCDGLLLSKDLNQGLYGVIGTQYGGNGVTNFALPDFRGRLPIHFREAAPTIAIGEKGGWESTTLLLSQLPPHTHRASTEGISCHDSIGDSPIPTNRYPGYSSLDNSYINAKDCQEYGYAAEAETKVGVSGESKPLENRMPSRYINFIMATAALARGPFLGEIQIFCGNYAPEGWQFCDGQTLNIDDFGALYSVIETTYGGDGVNDFALPDLRGRAPVGVSNAGKLGDAFGVKEVEFKTDNMPQHLHTVTTKFKVGKSFAREGTPKSNYWAYIKNNEYASSPEPYAYMADDAVQVNLHVNDSKSSQLPIDNQQPLIALNFIICVDGIRPSPSGNALPIYFTQQQ